MRPNLVWEVSSALEYLRAGRIDRARKTLSALIDSAPDDADVLCGWSQLLAAEGNFESAIDAATNAVNARPEDLTLVSMLLHLLSNQEKWLDVERLSRQAMERFPQNPNLAVYLAAALISTFRTLEGSEWVEKSAVWGADPKVVAMNRAMVLREWGYSTEAIAIVRDLVRQNPKDVALMIRLVSGILYSDQENPGSLRQSFESLGNHLHRIAPKVNKKAKGLPDKRLRVAYVSPDLRQHSVAYFLEPLLAQHDRTAFEIIGVTINSISDQVTERLKAHFEGWIDVSGMADSSMCEAINAADVDILVDLAGYTGGCRPLLFAPGLAPIQVSYLGFPATLGMPSISARIGDAVADGPASDIAFVEPVFRLDRTFLSYVPDSNAPEVEDLPALTRGALTFGSFNVLDKVSDSCIRLWSNAMHSVEGSRMILKSKGFQDPTVVHHTILRFAKFGIDSERLSFLARTASLREHLGLYGQIDIALDTCPYNGTTTTCESLWMGVPVFTVLGEMHHERVSASILNAVGLPELVGETQEDMVKRVVSCCADITALATLRASLRDRVSSSPLCDGADLARQIESVYRKLWIQALGRDV